jgi:hypothetical protein
MGIPQVTMGKKIPKLSNDLDDNCGYPHDLGKPPFFVIVPMRGGFLPSFHVGSQLQIQQKCQLLGSMKKWTSQAPKSDWLVVEPYPSEK